MKECGAEERSSIINNAATHPDLDLYILADVETYEIGKTVRVFELTRGNKPCYFLQLRSNCVVSYDTPQSSLQVVFDYIQAFRHEKKITHINGNPQFLALLGKLLPQYDLEECMLASCAVDNFKPFEITLDSTFELRRLQTREDYKALLDLCDRVGKPKASNQEEQEAFIAKKMNYDTQSCACFGVFEGTKLVSTAATSAASSYGAMIVDVATDPDYRRRGFAGLVVTQLCQYCFDAGIRAISLYYNNPAAARIYFKLGFQERAPYGFLKLHEG